MNQAEQVTAIEAEVTQLYARTRKYASAFSKRLPCAPHLNLANWRARDKHSRLVAGDNHGRPMSQCW